MSTRCCMRCCDAARALHAQSRVSMPTHAHTPRHIPTWRPRQLQSSQVVMAQVVMAQVVMAANYNSCMPQPPRIATLRHCNIATSMQHCVPALRYPASARARAHTHVCTQTRVQPPRHMSMCSCSMLQAVNAAAFAHVQTHACTHV